MKQLVCEMCGSADLIKDEGVFVCQSCGCKYTVEEAKKMMIEGTVEVAGTIKVDDTAKIDNYLELSNNAYSAGNGQSAFDYANKALEIAPQNSMAWIAKMKSIEYMGTLGELKLMEVFEAGKNAVAFAADERKSEITHEVYLYQASRALQLLKLAMSKMNDTEDIRNTFKQFSMISFLTASQNTLSVDSKIVNIYDNIASEALALIKLIPDDVLVDFPDITNIVGECAKQYQYETNALISRYKIYGATLQSSAQTVRATNKRQIEDKCNKALREGKAKQEKIAREEAQKRFDEYWSLHAEERKTLQEKQDSLQLEISCLDEKKTALLVSINEIEKKWTVKLPVEEQIQNLTKDEQTLRMEISKLGLFSGKKKKELKEKIDGILLQKSRLTSELEKQKADLKAKANEEQKPLNLEIEEIDNQLSDLIKEKNIITTELTKAR